MKRNGLLILALAAIAVGAVGLLTVSTLLSGALGGAYSSSGQRIYYTGANTQGPIPRTVAGGAIAGFGMMGNAACVGCHGQDGRGGRVGMMSGSVVIPDIRYSTLTSARSEGTATLPPWTDADIARAIREGIEPDGNRLVAPMPRWAMTDADVKDLIAYLKELSRR
jgi:cytochrome c oxidase subunit 2